MEQSADKVNDKETEKVTDKNVQTPGTGVPLPTLNPGPFPAKKVVVRKIALFRVCAAIPLGLWLGPGLALADEVVLTASADATLIERAPNNSSGGGIFFNAGTTQVGTRNRALIQFDLSPIPSGAIITAATLSLNVVREPGCGSADATFGLYRVLRPWGEGSNVPTDNAGGLGAPAQPGDATWNSRFFGTSQTWAAPGGAPDVDYASNPSSSAVVYGPGQSPYQFESTLDTAGDLQRWLDNPGTNFGWMLICQAEDTPFTARRFASREDPFGNGPVLTVDFEVVPEPAPLALAMFLLGLAAYRCLRRGVARPSH